MMTTAMNKELKSVLDGIPSGMCIYRVDQGRLYPLYHNPAFFKVLGSSGRHAQVMEQVDFIGVHEDDRAALQLNLAGLLGGGESLRHTCRLFHDELGEYRWICIEGSRRVHHDGTELLYAVYSDVTEQRRMEQYFQNTLKNLPGGVVVVRYETDGSIVPEYISEGLAVTTGMTLKDTWELYQEDALTGVHPDDLEGVRRQLDAYLVSGKNHWEIEYRLLKGNGEYVWVKNTLSLIEHEGGERKIYSTFNDMTKEREERARVRQQYDDLLLRHHQRSDPNVLVTGHCNITQDRIIQISDQTGAGLLEAFGAVREDFFIGLSTLVEDEEERQSFRNTYLRAPALAAFERGETKRTQDVFVKLPNEGTGRYVRVEMNLVSTPDSGDVTGILTVLDITEQTISNRISCQLSVTGYDFVADVDLRRDTYKIISLDEKACCVPPHQGVHSFRVDRLLQSGVVPRDREQFRDGLNPGRMLERLKHGQTYTFSYSMDDNGDIRTKNITVAPIDLRLGRVCLSRTDITDSIREQQRLLRVIAYTCELAGFIDAASGSFIMYTRQMILENLPPHTTQNYNEVLDNLAGCYGTAVSHEEVKHMFCLETLLHRLAEKPEGYDFVLPYQVTDSLRYKQVNVLWGDQNHKTVCLVRSDVTDMLAAERAAKTELERALKLSLEASLAKSDFLSAMSHDIRTPMNAIMGMTTLAKANSGDPVRVLDCLQKISAASGHLLNLINDVLDMNKIERAQITLNREKIYLPDLIEQIGEIIAPQAEQAGLCCEILPGGIRNPCFYGDTLRISQILINILGNAVKFTPRGGSVRFLAEEIPGAAGSGQACYRFTVRDTGIGIAKETLDHLFEPFVRSRAVSRVEGTGLGLSIVKGLVDLMGGSVSVQSEPEKGTTFFVELKGEVVESGEWRPLREPQLPETAGKGLFTGRRILIAEDNEINAEIICEILRMCGIITEVESNGALAVEAFFSAAPGTYDAILMDIQMPEMDGYEAARIIRADGRTDAKVIPIIAMTANAFEQDVKTAMEAGMDAHIAKPIDVNILYETLTQVMGREA